MVELHIIYSRLFRLKYGRVRVNLFRYYSGYITAARVINCVIGRYCGHKNR